MDQNSNSINRPVKKRRQHKSWIVEASDIARNTFNPIRSIVDGMKLTPNPDKAMIALSIGKSCTFRALTRILKMQPKRYLWETRTLTTK